MEYFSNNEYQYIKDQLSELYRDDFEELTEIYHTNRDHLKPFKVVFEDNLKLISSFTPINFFWADQYANYLEILEFHVDSQEMDSVDEELKHDIIIDYWSNSDFTADFKVFLESNDNLDEISSMLLPKMESHLVNLFKKHILKSEISGEYRPQFELGDTSNFNELEVNSFKLIAIDENTENHKQRIQAAIDKIKKYSPSSYSRLVSFTNTIVPLNEPGTVSYSMQNLPGYSILNLYERDDIDLMDDLIHENGHHHLNYYLNRENLIYEDDDKIFYSPWREAQRPIRGIYHAEFTFYFALKMFSDLLNPNTLNDFTKEQQKKIKVRFCEEYLMLSYCIVELHKAMELDKISDQGIELIQFIFDQIKSEKDLYKQVNQDVSEEIEDLKNLLEEKVSKL